MKKPPQKPSIWGGLLPVPSGRSQTHLWPTPNAKCSPAALSHLLLKKSGCKIGVLRGHIDSSQFLEDVLAVDCNEHLCGCLVVVLRAGDGGDVSERLLYVVLGVLATTKINQNCVAKRQ